MHHIETPTNNGDGFGTVNGGDYVDIEVEDVLIIVGILILLVGISVCFALIFYAIIFCCVYCCYTICSRIRNN